MIGLNGALMAWFLRLDATKQVVLVVWCVMNLTTESKIL